MITENKKIDPNLESYINAVEVKNKIAQFIEKWHLANNLLKAEPIDIPAFIEACKVFSESYNKALEEVQAEFKDNFKEQNENDETEIQGSDAQQNYTYYYLKLKNEIEVFFRNEASELEVSPLFFELDGTLTRYKMQMTTELDNIVTLLSPASQHMQSFINIIPAIPQDDKPPVLNDDVIINGIIDATIQDYPGDANERVRNALNNAKNTASLVQLLSLSSLTWKLWGNESGLFYVKSYDALCAKRDRNCIVVNGTSHDLNDYLHYLANLKQLVEERENNKAFFYETIIAFYQVNDESLEYFIRGLLALSFSETMQSKLGSFLNDFTRGLCEVVFEKKPNIFKKILKEVVDGPKANISFSELKAKYLNNMFSDDITKEQKLNLMYEVHEDSPRGKLAAVADAATICNHPASEDLQRLSESVDEAYERYPKRESDLRKIATVSANLSKDIFLDKATTQSKSVKQADHLAKNLKTTHWARTIGLGLLTLTFGVATGVFAAASAMTLSTGVATGVGIFCVGVSAVSAATTVFFAKETRDSYKRNRFKGTAEVKQLSNNMEKLTAPVESKGNLTF